MRKNYLHIARSSGLVILFFLVTSISTNIYSQGQWLNQLSEFKSQSKNGNIGLTWKTISEESLLQFEVEYSTDGKNFRRIGIVPASKRPNGDIYEFEHSVAYTDSAFYRLKMVDYARRAQYSDAIIVDPNKLTTLFVYPSIITTGIMNIFLNDPFQSLAVVSMNGTVMLTQNLSGKTGRINVPLASSVAAGMYIVQLTDRGRTITQKVIVR